MVADLVETLADKDGFSVTVHAGKNGTFEVSSSDTRTMVSLLLQRQRVGRLSRSILRQNTPVLFPAP